MPSGKADSEVLQLTLDAAIQAALKQNLGVVLSDQGARAAAAERIRALSALLPRLTAGVSEQVQQENLAARGIKIPGAPRIIGPFGVFDARAYLSQSIFDLAAINRQRSAKQDFAAANYSLQDARNLVVFTTAAAYLQVIAASARIESAEAQVATAHALHQKAVDQHTSGVIPAIDSLRSQVELQARQQQLIVVKNAFDRGKLDLARIIGLPLGQRFAIADKIPYAALVDIGLDQALEHAYLTRPDFKNAEASVRAAEFTRKAAVSELLPSVGVDANYGDIGITPGNSHGTFHVAGTMRLSLFDGGRIRADVVQADSLLQQRKARMEDIRGRIDYDVRVAFLNLTAASEQLRVGNSSVDLARQALAQAQDRFSAGVSDNLEVVQAQEAFALANDTYIDSLYAYNLGKLALASAMGVVEQEGKRFLQGK